MGSRKDLGIGRPRLLPSSHELALWTFTKQSLQTHLWFLELSHPFKEQGHDFRVKDTEHLSKQACCRSLVKTAAFHHCPCLALWMERSQCCCHGADVVFRSTARSWWLTLAEPRLSPQGRIASQGCCRGWREGHLTMYSPAACPYPTT